MSDEVFEKLTGIRGAFRTRIAYVVQKNGGSQPYEVRVADYDGYNQFIVNRSSQPIMSPAWSPDGKRLAYVSFENKKSQLVVQDLGSGSRKVVASFPGHNGAPAFSPDGSKLAFASSQDGLLNIYVMGSNGGTPTQLTRGAGNNTEQMCIRDRCWWCNLRGMADCLLCGVFRLLYCLIPRVSRVILPSNRF